MDEDVQGEYELDHDDQSVMFKFSHVGQNGVEVFETDMPFETAREFANSVLACCDCGEGH